MLADEHAAEFDRLEAALFAGWRAAPHRLRWSVLGARRGGALQAVLARRGAIAAWRLARAERIAAELFSGRHVAGGGPGACPHLPSSGLTRGSVTRSFAT